MAWSCGNDGAAGRWPAGHRDLHYWTESGLSLRAASATKRLSTDGGYSQQKYPNRLQIENFVRWPCLYEDVGNSGRVTPPREGSGRGLSGERKWLLQSPGKGARAVLAFSVLSTPTCGARCAERWLRMSSCRAAERRGNVPTAASTQDK